MQHEVGFLVVLSEEVNYAYGMQCTIPLVNEIHDFRKQLNFSRLGCLCIRRFAMRFACLSIDTEHGKF